MNKKKFLRRCGAVCTLLATGHVFGDTTWKSTAAAGSWFNAFNWSAGIPKSTDNATIGFQDGTNHTVTYDPTAVSDTYSTDLALRIYNNNPAPPPFGFASKATLLVGASATGSNSIRVGQLYLGQVGIGEVVQTGGAITVSQILDLGLNGTGTYSLSNGSLYNSGTLGTVKGEYIGDQGTGVFTHSSGTNTASVGLTVGFAAGASGTYTLGLQSAF